MFILPQTPYVQGFVPFQAEFTYSGILLYPKGSSIDPSAEYIRDFLIRAKSENVDYVEFTKSCLLTQKV